MYLYFILQLLATAPIHKLRFILPKLLDEDIDKDQCIVEAKDCYRFSDDISRRFPGSHKNKDLSKPKCIFSKLEKLLGVFVEIFMIASMENGSTAYLSENKIYCKGANKNKTNIGGNI